MQKQKQCSSFRIVHKLLNWCNTCQLFYTFKLWLRWYSWDRKQPTSKFLASIKRGASSLDTLNNLTHLSVQGLVWCCVHLFLLLQITLACLSINSICESEQSARVQISKWSNIWLVNLWVPVGRVKFLGRTCFFLLLLERTVIYFERRKRWDGETGREGQYQHS